MLSGLYGAGAFAGPVSALALVMLGYMSCDTSAVAQEATPESVARGEKESFRGDGLNFIGMPVGGIGAGQLYLCGDGTLGCWEIFNRHEYRGTGERSYAGRKIEKPVDQGFAVVIGRGDKREAFCLNRHDFPDVEFTGTYPIGQVHYHRPDVPVDIRLEAFSPFIPLNAKNSALPATLFAFVVKNISDKPLQAACLGWLENAVCLRNAEDVPGLRRTTFVNKEGRAFALHSAEETTASAVDPGRPQIMLQDFEGSGYGGWKSSGESFGSAPATGALPWQSEVIGIEGKGFANSFLRGDSTVGELVSPGFVIERKYINFLLGGGEFPGVECVNLLVNGAVARSSTGQNDERLRWETWNVEDLAGKQAQVQVSDHRPFPGGHIMADQFEMADVKRRNPGCTFDKMPDFGTMALALNGHAADMPIALEIVRTLDGPIDKTYGGLSSFPEKHNAVLMSTFEDLAPGAERAVTFALAWHFPNAPHGHEYATRFPDAGAVANYVLDNFEKLAGDTRQWRDTYYDSSLPYWLLDRLHSTVANLATGTCQWWANGRFWAYEGVVSCPGTCTHVWNYAQAEARLFPELARSVREMQDFNSEDGGYHPDTGLVGFRGDSEYAADGQCGSVLKAYREHLTSPDDGFLKRNWPNIKKALEYMLQQDANDDGLIENDQPNTYDIGFQGANTYVGALYLAALRAAEEMARDLGDTAFAGRLRHIFESGKALSVAKLWNGEYFTQDVDLAKFPQNQYGPGCLSDQLFGQSWAHQVGLGELYPVEHVKQALESIWKYNWGSDVGPYNAAHPVLRLFAQPAEPGLFVCTWPMSPYLDGSFFYKNEVWTGIEYQVAANMIWEGLTGKGLAICRGIHERYHPSKRNPYNEVECGDHYARSLASWGVFTALCGFDYDGPNDHIAFAPRITPENFKAAFTAAEGWGSFSQKREGKTQRDRIQLRWGKLPLKTVSFDVSEKMSIKNVSAQAKSVPAKIEYERNNNTVTVVLKEAFTLNPEETLEVTIE